MAEMSPVSASDPEAEARRYHRQQFVLAILSFLLTVALLVAWQASGFAAALTGALEDRLGSRTAVVALVLGAVGASTTLAAFPLDVVRGFVLPRRAGLLSQSIASWLGDKVKGMVLGAVIGLLAVELLYALLAWSPTWWWLAGAAALTVGSAVLTAVVPIWIVPLFYRLTPLEDAGLRTRLLALAAHSGVKAAEVMVADFSRKGRTANAAVVGLGRTRRILLSDTLLSGFSAEEIEVVLAHELAHHARGHLRQALALQAGLLLVVLGLVHLGLALTGPALGLRGAADPAGLPLLALLLVGLGVAVTPVAAAWSRRLERQADADALAVTGAPGAFVSAMERFGRLNLAERRPHRLKEWLFATHPSLEQRIAFARGHEQAVRGAA